MHRWRAPSPIETGAETSYLVLFKKTGPDAAAERAITKAGGRIDKVNAKIGYAYVTSRNSRFRADVAATGAVEGAAAERVVGKAPQLRRPASSEIERLTKEANGWPTTPTTAPSRPTSQRPVGLRTTALTTR